jgi:hypothetical protein
MESADHKRLKLIEKLTKENDTLTTNYERLLAAHKLLTMKYECLKADSLSLTKINKRVFKIPKPYAEFDELMNTLTPEDTEAINAAYPAIDKLFEIVFCGKYIQFKNIILPVLDGGKYINVYSNVVRQFRPIEKSSIIRKNINALLPYLKLILTRGEDDDETKLLNTDGNEWDTNLRRKELIYRRDKKNYEGDERKEYDAQHNKFIREHKLHAEAYTKYLDNACENATIMLFLNHQKIMNEIYDSSAPEI